MRFTTLNWVNLNEIKKIKYKQYKINQQFNERIFGKTDIAKKY